MLFVNNLPREVDGCELKRLFSEFGKVVHAKVIYHHTGARWESKEFGVVTMATREWLKDAIRGLNKVVSQTLFYPDDGHGSQSVNDPVLAFVQLEILAPTWSSM